VAAAGVTSSLLVPASTRVSLRSTRATPVRRDAGAPRRRRRDHPGQSFHFIIAQTMATSESIEQSIAAGLDCVHLQVVGDGHHWEALIVSRAFEGLSKVRQHQLVYKALGDRMREEIHALSMTTLTPAQWDEMRKAG